MSGHRPPRWLERILEWTLPSGLSGHGTLGDLAEGFERRALTSAGRARLWYAGQAASILVYRVFTGSGAESSAGNSDLVMDLRWSARSVLKHPGFSFAVVAVLGLGLGTNAAVYSVVDGTLENTSWWSEPDRTVAVWPDNQFSFGQLELYADEQTAYDAVGGYVELAFALRTPDGESQSVNGVLITPELFRALAVQPGLGRALADDDAIFGVEPVVVISEALWRQSFGSDPGIVGRQINVSGGAVTVVGVQGAGGMAPGGRAELWLPLVMDPRDDDFWKAHSHTMVGVLRPGADLDDAEAELMAFTNRLSDLFPMFYPEGWADGVASVARADEAQRRLVATPLLLLFAGTALLLLVTALNVGNLLLGRAIDRRKELAVRASLGAGKGRIVRQLLAEGFVLTALALALGLVTASFGGDWIADLFVEAAVVASSPVLSPAVLTFALGVSVLAWLVLNGVPVVHFLRTHRSGLTVAPDSGATMQRSLVTVQAALATLLLVSATLLVGTVDNLRRVPLGFEPGGLLTVELSPPEDRVASIPVARELYGRLVERAAALPGVEAVGLTGWLPLRAQAPTTPINLQAAPVDPREAPRAPMHMVDPGFFETFDVRPIAGRLLGSEDRALDAPSAVVVNETLARTLWPDGSAVGQLIAIDPHAWNSWAPVVGVVPDIRSGEMTGAIGPALYVSLAESPSRDVTLVVRTAGASAGLAPMLRRAVNEVDPLVPVRSISWMSDVVRAAYAVSWVMMGLLIVLAVLATGLGAIGIYAVLAHHVSLTRREIGVRMALGADPGVVVAGVVRSGLLLAGVGIAIGSVAAAISSRFLEALLFEVSTLAPWAFVAPAVGLAAAAAVAAWIPAARAGRLPPAEVLKSD
jgi:predicted permease